MPEDQRRQLPIIPGRHRFELHRLNIMLNVVVGFGKSLGTRLGVLRVGEGVAQREHAPAGTIAGIEHRDFVPCLDQFVRRRKSGEPCAGDYDFFRRTTRGRGCGSKERSLEKIAPAGFHGRIGALTAAGGAGVFFARGRNAQHQIATLVR